MTLRNDQQYLLNKNSIRGVCWEINLIQKRLFLILTSSSSIISKPGFLTLRGIKPKSWLICRNKLMTLWVTFWYQSRLQSRLPQQICSCFRLHRPNGFELSNYKLLNWFQLMQMSKSLWIQIWLVNNVKQIQYKLRKLRLWVIKNQVEYRFFRLSKWRELIHHHNKFHRLILLRMRISLKTSNRRRNLKIMSHQRGIP